MCPQAVRTCKEVLQSFYSLMSASPHELDEMSGLQTSSTVMQLLDSLLPSMTEASGWDVPLVACLAGALSLASQLGLVISLLVSQSLKILKSSGKSSKEALGMLEEAFKHVLTVLRQREDKMLSQVFVAVVLARELVMQSVSLVEKAMEDDDFLHETEVDRILNLIAQVLQIELSTHAEFRQGVPLCQSAGREVVVDGLPSPFASLYVVAATRRSKMPLPTNIAIQQLTEVVALKAVGSELHRLLEAC